MTTVAPTFGYAAFAREDVEDAKRRGPGLDISDYAAARGLQYLGSALPSGFVAVTPEFPAYLLNTMRGLLPGGHYGFLAHRLFEVGLTDDGPAMPGSFFGQRSVSRSGRPWWDVLGMFPRQAEHAPFAANAIWLPTSTAAARVTEGALLPRTVVRRSENFSWAGSRKLEGFGLGGFRMEDGPADEGLLCRLFGGPIGALLRGMPYAFVELTIDAGTVALIRNGYAKEERELDELAGQIAALADGVRAACAPLLESQPFTVALPAPRPESDSRPQGKLQSLHVDYDELVRPVADQMGLAIEDRQAFHRAFPDQPVPGVAQGVLRGPLRGSSGPDGRPVYGRMVWTGDGVRPLGGWIRGAVLVPARPGATTAGPVLVPETAMFAEVRGGLAACWGQKRRKLELAAPEVLEAALTTLRRLGLADV